jgi:hypothetical protein
VIAAIATERTEIRCLEVALIRLDGQTQSRASLNPSVVEEYAQLMTDGVVFPPVRVWFDGKSYWLTDGFHRVEAARRAGLIQISIELFHGSLEDARWDSLRANTMHGLRRSKKDLELVVARAFRHQRATGLSTNQLAKHLGIPEPTLRRWMKHASSTDEDESQIRVAWRNGSAYVMKTDRIGSHPAVTPLRAGHRLVGDLEFMRAKAAGRETQFFLNLLDKWFMGLIGPEAVIESINRMVRQKVNRER